MVRRRRSSVRLDQPLRPLFCRTPVAVTKLVGGFSLIEAEDIAQAVDLSKGCPILEVEGSVEVRPVMQINM
jgi:hypothetical protein